MGELKVAQNIQPSPQAIYLASTFSSGSEFKYTTEFRHDQQL